MALNIGKENFSWGHSKLIWTKKHHGHIQLRQLFFDNFSTMIGCIINHDNGVSSPVLINVVQMLAQFHNKVNECESVCHSLVNSEEKFAPISYCCYYIDIAKATTICHLIMFAPKKPSSFTMISQSHHAFINVDYPFTSVQPFNVH